MISTQTDDRLFIILPDSLPSKPNTQTEIMYKPTEGSRNTPTIITSTFAEVDYDDEWEDYDADTETDSSAGDDDTSSFVVDNETSTINTEFSAVDEVLFNPFYDENFIVIDEPFIALREILKGMTESTVHPLVNVGPDPETLRKFYSEELLIAADDYRLDSPLTSPPCPYITLIAMDRAQNDCGCYCCMPADLPRIRINAGEVGGGVLTMRAVLLKLRSWVYGEIDADKEAISRLQAPVKGLQVGEAGPVDFGFLMTAVDNRVIKHIRNFEVFLHFAKPLPGGGFKSTVISADHDRGYTLESREKLRLEDKSEILRQHAV